MNNFLNRIKTFFKTNSDVITPTAVLTVICIVVTLALSSANMITAKKITELSVKNQNDAMSKLIDADEYKAETAVLDGETVNYHTAVKDGENIGYIFTVDEKGYGGTVSVMTAINTDGTVAAVEIIDASNETPGLGQNVKNSNFYTQFKGLADNITVIRGGSANADNNEINAVTGATISSKAVTKAVNRALGYSAQITDKGDVS